MKLRIASVVLLVLNLTVMGFNAVQNRATRTQITELQEKADREGRALSECARDAREAQDEAKAWRTLAVDAAQKLERATDSAAQSMGLAHAWEKQFCNTTEGRTISFCKAENHGRP